MTRPTEAQLVEMEQRARWLLDGIEIARREPRPHLADYMAVDTREAIARDVLLLVGLFREKEQRRAGVLSPT